MKISGRKLDYKYWAWYNLDVFFFETNESTSSALRLKPRLFTLSAKHNVVCNLAFPLVLLPRLHEVWAWAVGLYRPPTEPRERAHPSDDSTLAVAVSATTLHLSLTTFVSWNNALFSQTNNFAAHIKPSHSTLWLCICWDVVVRWLKTTMSSRIGQISHDTVDVRCSVMIGHKSKWGESQSDQSWLEMISSKWHRPG